MQLTGPTWQWPVTIFVEAKPGELGWILPDGTRVYYKNAFLKTEQDGTVVSGANPSGQNGEIPVSSGASEQSTQASFYHVVEMQKTSAGEEYKFIQGMFIPRRACQGFN